MKKCRVYDKHLKIVRDVKCIDFANKEVMYYADEFEGNEDEANLDMARNFKEVDIMNAIGLVDKNGKLIYECDICFSTHENYKGKCEVVWDYLNLQWKTIKISDPSISKKLCNFKSKELEVVGNIYENSELSEEVEE